MPEVVGRDRHVQPGARSLRARRVSHRTRLVTSIGAALWQVMPVSAIRCRHQRITSRSAERFDRCVLLACGCLLAAQQETQITDQAVATITGAHRRIEACTIATGRSAQRQIGIPGTGDRYQMHIPGVVTPRPLPAPTAACFICQTRGSACSRFPARRPGARHRWERSIKENAHRLAAGSKPPMQTDSHARSARSRRDRRPHDRG